MHIVVGMHQIITLITAYYGYYAPNYYYGPGPYGYVTSGVYW